MRVLNTKEIEQVSGGFTKISPAQRALPGSNVTPNLPGNRTGWCRGYGNVKDAIAKHAGTDFPCPGVPQ